MQVLDIVCNSKSHSVCCWLWFKSSILDDEVSRTFLQAENLKSKEELLNYLSNFQSSKLPFCARPTSDGRDKFVEEIYFWYKQIFLEKPGLQLRDFNGAPRFFLVQDSRNVLSDICGILFSLPTSYYGRLQRLTQGQEPDKRLIVLFSTSEDQGVLCGPLSMVGVDEKSEWVNLR